jgi:hypothetical protein
VIGEELGSVSRMSAVASASTVRPSRPSRSASTEVTRDLIGYESALEVINGLGVVRIDDIDLEVTRRAEERYSSVADDFGSIRGTGHL